MTPIFSFNCVYSAFVPYFHLWSSYRYEVKRKDRSVDVTAQDLLRASMKKALPVIIDAARRLYSQRSVTYPISTIIYGGNENFLDTGHVIPV